MSAPAHLLRLDPVAVIEGAEEDEQSLNLRRELFVQRLALDPTVPEVVRARAQWFVDRQAEVEATKPPTKRPTPQRVCRCEGYGYTMDQRFERVPCVCAGRKR